MTISIEERMLYMLLAPAVTDGLLVSEHHGYIDILAADGDENDETLDLTEHVITRRIIQALVSANLVTIKTPRAAQAPLADERLRDPLREGFEEGRNPQPPTMAPQPQEETYEQLQLPGMED